MTDKNQNTRPRLPMLAVMASVLIILHAAALAVSMRYAYISTDILAKAEADILIIAASVISPLCIYFRLGFLILGSFIFVKKASLPFLFCAIASLLAGAGCDLFLSASYDAYFSGNESLYVIASALSLVIGIAAFLVIRAYTEKRSLAAASEKSGKRPLVKSFLFGAAVLFIIDTLYRTYTLLSMIFSAEGVSFATAEDYLYLAYDYLYPLAEAALGFAFMCLCGVVFKRLFVKKNG